MSFCSCGYSVTTLSVTLTWVGWLCWGLTSQSTIFQSCRDGAIASWVINQYFRGVKCLAQGHNTAAVGLEPRTSRSRVRHSTTEPPRSPLWLGRKVYDISPGHSSLEKQNRLLRRRQGLFRGWTWLFVGTRPPENSAAAISVRRFLTRGGHLGVFHCATCINVIYKDTIYLSIYTVSTP